MSPRILAVVFAVGFALSPGLVHAQATAEADFTSFSNLTAGQQASINQASAFLTSVGENLSGITICGADTHGQGLGAATQDGTTIGIDFKVLEGIVPPETPGAPGFPGLVMIAMYHELQHLHHGWGRTYCDEIGIRLTVAQKQCEFIIALALEGLGPLDAQCQFYAFFKNKTNDAQKQAEIQEHGCMSPTGSTVIAPCSGCP